MAGSVAEAAEEGQTAAMDRINFLLPFAKQSLKTIER